jgi:hypothetical protein
LLCMTASKRSGKEQGNQQQAQACGMTYGSHVEIVTDMA